MGLTIQAILGSNQPQTLSGIETISPIPSTTKPRAPTNPKPSQGLKPCRIKAEAEDTERSNQPQTLSGIETATEYDLAELLQSSNQPQTLSGIETTPTSTDALACDSSNQPQTLSGIETTWAGSIARLGRSSNQPQTLSGIETGRFDRRHRLSFTLQPTPNPLRD